MANCPDVTWCVRETSSPASTGLTRCSVREAWASWWPRIICSSTNGLRSEFLLPQAIESPEAVARFAREARAACKIKSDHVVRVTDVGTLDSGSPYMVMEYLDGIDVAELVRRRGMLPVGEAVELVLQACEAIAEAHSLGIVHRDLKRPISFAFSAPGFLMSRCSTSAFRK